MNEETRQIVENIANQAALKVYQDQATQYGVANTSVHTHNGVDSSIIPASSVDAFVPLSAQGGGIASPSVLLSQKINDSTQASNNVTANIFNSPSVYVNALPTIYGQSNGLLTMTGNAANGATSATLTTAYPYDTGTRMTTFFNTNNDQRPVLYTKGSTGITWVTGLTSITTSTTLSVIGAPFAFNGGTAPAGTMILFSNEQNQNAPALWVFVNNTPGFTSGAFILTAGVAAGAASATLTAAWTNITGRYNVTFSSGEQRLVTFINGSTSISWSTVLTVSATANITVSGGSWWGIGLNQLLVGP